MDISAFNVLSICSGGGGLDLGLKLAVPDARTICYVENEAFACEVLASQIDAGNLDEAPIWTDLKTFDGHPWRGIVDCVAGGYPCQPMSVSGSQKGQEDVRYLFPDVARIVSECQPSFVFFENVSNHLRIGYNSVRAKLQEIGYRVEQGIFTAEEVGGPHLRKRLFILGYNKELEVAHARCQHGQRRQDLQDWNCIENGNKPVDRKEEVHSAERSSKNVARQQEELAHTSGRGRGIVRKPPRECRQPDGCRKAMVDAVSRGRGQGRIKGRLLGISESQQDNSSETSEPSRILCCESQNLFPPGPDEHEKWSEILQAYPTLEPSVRFVANELAPELEQSYMFDRSLQLRLLGNGVVPTTAAFAFCILIAKLVSESPN